jgi:hypothetical protein
MTRRRGTVGGLDRKVYVVKASRTRSGVGAGRRAKRTETVSVRPSITGTWVQLAEIRNGVCAYMSNKSLPTCASDSESSPKILSVSHSTFSFSPEMYVQRGNTGVSGT